jgi:hypothetical protein
LIEGAAGVFEVLFPKQALDLIQPLFVGLYTTSRSNVFEVILIKRRMFEQIIER